MRKYLDFEKDVITQEYIEKVRQNIYKKYGIDLRKLLDNDEKSIEEIKSLIIKKYMGNMNYDSLAIEKMRFLNIEYREMNLPIGNYISKEGKAVDKDFDRADGGSVLYDYYQKEDNIEPENSKKDVLGLYERIINWANVPEMEIPISFEEWEQQMKYIIIFSEIFTRDSKLKWFISLKYSSMSNKSYRLYDEVKRKEIKAYDRLSKEEYFPFKNKNELPFFIKELLDILVNEQRYIRVFDFEIFGKKDVNIKSNNFTVCENITRYSYMYVEEIFNKLANSKLENFYCLDYMLGISLTNTIFNYIFLGTYSSIAINDKKMSYGNAADLKNINSRIYKLKCLDLRNQEDLEHVDLGAVSLNPDIFCEELFNIIKVLGRLEGLYGRNYIAQITFNFLYMKDFTIEEIRKVYHHLEQNICKYNEYFRDLYNVSTWHIFHDARSEEKIEVMEELESEFKEIIKNSICDEGIRYITRNNKNEEKRENTIRRTKSIKEADNLYAQVHKAVMQGIWER